MFWSFYPTVQTLSRIKLALCIEPMYDLFKVALTRSRQSTMAHYAAAPPNHSLNRTHYGMRLKARHFILGL